MFDDVRNAVESIPLAGQYDAVVVRISLAFLWAARFTQPSLVGELISLNGPVVNGCLSLG